MQLTHRRRALATGAVVLGVLLGAAGISAAATGSAPAHRQTTTTPDLPEANDTPDSVDTPEVSDAPDSPDTPEPGDRVDAPDTPEPAGDHADLPDAATTANAQI
jgi:hypothetical protein